jgi:uncharacterized protein YlxP (DUF503 family)
LGLGAGNGRRGLPARAPVARQLFVEVLKSLVQRARKRFNISIAEVEDQDLWQKAVLGICAAGNDRQRVNSTMDQVINFIEQTQMVDVANSEFEIVNY